MTVCIFQMQSHETCKNRLECFECTSSNYHHPMCSNRIQHGDFQHGTTEFHPVKGGILRRGATDVRRETMLGEYVGEFIGRSANTGRCYTGFLLWPIPLLTIPLPLAFKKKKRVF